MSKSHELSEDEVRISCLNLAVASEDKTFSLKDDDNGDLLDARILKRAEAFYVWMTKERTGIKIPEIKPCWINEKWGECVLADGHETMQTENIGDSPETEHIDRWGKRWGVADANTVEDKMPTAAELIESAKPKGGETDAG